jgi:hypothetical protein
VRRGDRLVVADGGTAEVVCVVKTQKNEKMVEFRGGLTISQGHPMRVNGEWILPCHVEGGRLIENPHGFVYNYVLDRNHVLLVDGR